MDSGKLWSNYSCFQQTTYGDQCIGEEGTGIGIPIGIGENSYIRKAIIDKNVRIGKNIRITNKDNVQEGNREALGYIISGGIVIVLRNTVIPDGSILWELQRSEISYKFLSI